MGNRSERLQSASKPNSVPPGGKPPDATIIPLGPPLLAASSDLPGSFGRAVLERFPIWSCSVRGFACHLLYSRRGALLPHHFTLTSVAPVDATQCTRRTWQELARPTFAAAPLHVVNRNDGGGIFSVPLFLQVTLTGRYPAHCPAEFGLSSPPYAICGRRGDHLAHCDALSVPHGAEGRGQRAKSQRKLSPLLSSLRGEAALAVRFLPYRVLLQLLVEIAAGRADDFGSLRDVPAVLPQLLYQPGALG